MHSVHPGLLKATQLRAIESYDPTAVLPMPVALPVSNGDGGFGGSGSGTTAHEPRVNTGAADAAGDDEEEGGGGAAGGGPHDMLRQTLRGMLESCGKLRQFVRLVRSLREGHFRVLVFSQWSRVLDIIGVVLRAMDQRALPAEYDPASASQAPAGKPGGGLPPAPRKVRFLRIDGSVAMLERARLVDQFNSDAAVSVCLLTTGVGSLGLTLTSATRVIIFDVRRPRGLIRGKGCGVGIFDAEAACLRGRSATAVEAFPHAPLHPLARPAPRSPRGTPPWTRRPWTARTASGSTSPSSRTASSPAAPSRSR